MEKEFKNNNRIILEWCGKGEYTINLAKKFPANNYVGIDIKALNLERANTIENELHNVRFPEHK